MKSTLDYNVYYDQENVNFLDCSVKIRNGKFETEIFNKHTDVHLYLPASCHPKHTIHAIPKANL